MRTLVGTGSRQRHISRKARQRSFHAYFSWEECSGGGNNRSGTFQGEFSGGEYSGHREVRPWDMTVSRYVHTRLDFDTQRDIENNAQVISVIHVKKCIAQKTLRCITSNILVQISHVQCHDNVCHSKNYLRYRRMGVFGLKQDLQINFLRKHFSSMLSWRLIIR